MGRRKLNKARCEVQIDRRILAAVESRLTMKYSGRPQYGSISALVELLFRKWLEEEVLVDPLRPVSMTLNDILEENPNGEIPAPGSDAT